MFEAVCEVKKIPRPDTGCNTPYGHYLLRHKKNTCYTVNHQATMILLTLFALTMSTNLRAQTSERPKGFQAELLGGFNFSQLDGDQLSGFNKLGLRAGMRIGYALSPTKGWTMGLCFDQRGSRNTIFSSGGFNQHISLDYIAMPLSYYFDSWWYESFMRHKIRVSLSVIPARLLSIRSSHSGFDNALDSFKDWDLSLSAGLAYSLGPRASLNLRMERSVLKIYKPVGIDFSALQSYMVSVQYGYLLNQL